MERNKHRTTFFSANRMLNPDDKEFVGVTAILTLTNIKCKDTTEGRKIVTARAAVNNHSKMMSKMLGVDVPEQDGTTWVDVVFWDDKAERFTRFLKGRDKVRVCVVGSMKPRAWKHEDGTENLGVTITCFNWDGIPTHQLLNK